MCCCMESFVSYRDNAGPWVVDIGKFGPAIVVWVSVDIVAY